jgi:MFS family permease
MTPLAAGAPPEVRRSLSLSWKEGSMAAVMYAAVEYYLIPYGLFLGASAQQIGWLIALPHLIGSSAQLFAERLVRWSGSRRKFLVAAVSLQAALLIPVGLLALTAWPFRLTLLLWLIVGFRVAHHLILTVWGSLMSDYLPAHARGSYFGWRTKVVGLAGLAGMGAGGVWLSLMETRHPALSFFGLFLAAAAFRFGSAALLARQAELPWHPAEGSRPALRGLLRAVRDHHLVAYCGYIAGFVTAAFLAAPYFSVFMLRDLHFSYLTYMTLHVMTVLSGLFASSLWGHHADLVGNARILKVTGALIPVLPLLWLVCRHPVYLIAVEACSGFIWSGFVLCTTNFVYDAVDPPARLRWLGYFNLVNGLAICAGSALGGILADRLPPLLGFSMLSLFVLSGVLRAAVHLWLSPKIREVRSATTRASDSQLFLSLLGLRPLSG